MLAALTDQKVVRVLSVKHVGDSEPYCTVLTAVMGLERVMSVREKEIHTPINSSHQSPLQQPFPCHISSVRNMSDTQDTLVSNRYLRLPSRSMRRRPR